MRRRHAEQRCVPAPSRRSGVPPKRSTISVAAATKRSQAAWARSGSVSSARLGRFRGDDRDRTQFGIVRARSRRALGLRRCLRLALDGIAKASPSAPAVACRARAPADRDRAGTGAAPHRAGPGRHKAASGCGARLPAAGRGPAGARRRRSRARYGRCRRAARAAATTAFERLLAQALASCGEPVVEPRFAGIRALRRVSPRYSAAARSSAAALPSRRGPRTRSRRLQCTRRQARSSRPGR